MKEFDDHLETQLIILLVDNMLEVHVRIPSMVILLLMIKLFYGRDP